MGEDGQLSLKLLATTVGHLSELLHNHNFKILTSRFNYKILHLVLHDDDKN